MGWYASDDWRTLLESLEDIYSESCEFVNWEGDYTPTLPYWFKIHDVIDGLYDTADIDPMPVWDLWRMIDRHRQVRLNRVARPDSDPLELASVAKIADRLEQVMMIVERVRRRGVVDTAPRGADSGEIAANSGRLFLGPPPPNPDVRDLIGRIDGEPDRDRSFIEIARDFTGETPRGDSKAKSLLSQIRRLIKQKRVRPLREQ
ncbi:MAG: hypothetical protein AAGJ46_06670 [Planctomycetota bacterium]